MAVNLASRINALIPAGTIGAASWGPILSAPHISAGTAPVVEYEHGTRLAEDVGGTA